MQINPKTLNPPWTLVWVTSCVIPHAHKPKLQTLPGGSHHVHHMQMALIRVRLQLRGSCLGQGETFGSKGKIPGVSICKLIVQAT